MELNDIDKIYIANKYLKTVTIELVNHCNWRCKHCYLDKKVIVMDKTKVFEIIDDARKLGAVEIRLSGGEITIHPDLPEIIEYARKRYMDVVLLTNLYILSQNLLGCIKRYGVKRVEVTLFSLNDEVHDSFVGLSGALKQILHNMEVLNQENIEVLVKTWAIKSNINELEDMKEYFQKKGYLFNIHAQIYADINGKFKLPEDLRLTMDEYCKALYLSDKSLNRKFPLENKENNRLCVEFATSIYITSNGDVIPCAKYRKAISSIYKHSLEYIWKNLAEWHSIQEYRWRDAKACNECKNKPFCVRCGAMSYIKGYDFLENCSETCILAQIRSSNYKGKVENEKISIK